MHYFSFGENRETESSHHPQWSVSKQYIERIPKEIARKKKPKVCIRPPSPKHVSQDFSKTKRDIEKMTATETTRIPT